MECNKELGSKNERGHNTNDIWGNCSKREIIESIAVENYKLYVEER